KNIQNFTASGSPLRRHVVWFMGGSAMGSNIASQNTSGNVSQIFFKKSHLVINMIDIIQGDNWVAWALLIFSGYLIYGIFSKKDFIYLPSRRIFRLKVFNLFYEHPLIERLLFGIM